MKSKTRILSKFAGILLFNLFLAVAAMVSIRADLKADTGLANSCWPMFRQNLYHTGVSTIPVSGSSGKLRWSYQTGNQVG